MYPSTNKLDSNFTTTMKVVESKVNIEREVDACVNNIKTLIQKLSPTERQKYFNGLLNFILTKQAEHNPGMKTNLTDKGGELSETDLTLLTEMSGKLQELYQVMGDVD